MQRVFASKLSYGFLTVLGLSIFSISFNAPTSSRTQSTTRRPVKAASTGGFSFSTGMPDGRMGTASRPSGPGVEIESADDFILDQPTTIKSATFYGLLPSGAPLSNVNFVGVEIYRVFPLDSTDPPSGMVPTRANSPSDNAFASRDTGSANMTFTASIINASFTVANTVVNGINKIPNQTTGGEGPATGEEVLFNVIFTTPLVLPADHYFFKPEVGLSSGDFLWLSAPKPIVSPGTPFTPDLQSWIRNTPLDPDWLRIGTDIVGNTTFNAAFSLSSQTCSITCPGNITQPNDQDQCGAAVAYADPVANGNCGTVVCSPSSGAFFPVGTTTVICMNTPQVLGPVSGPPRDISCNPETITESTSQTITPDNSYTCSSGVSYWRAFDLTGSFGIPNDFDVQSVDIGIESATSGNLMKPSSKGARISSKDAKGKVHTQGTGQPVTVRLYTDSGGFPATVRTQIATADFTIADQALTIVNLPITATVPAGSELVVEVFAPNGKNPGNLFIIGSNSDPETAPSYVSAPDCGISDPTPTSDPQVDFSDMHIVMNVNGCEEVVSCSFTVTVQDTQGPTITCPANQVQCNDPNQCSAVVSYPAPTVNDNCPGGTSTCSPASGSVFPVGTTTVSCTGTDAAGNQSSAPCTFTVTVNDCQPPTINCLPAISGAATASCPIATSVPASFTVTASDNCPGTITIVCKDQSNNVVTPGQPLPVGTTTVTCTATDVAGNPVSCTFTVTEFSFCLQDDSSSGSVVLVNAQTGEYFFCCSGSPIASGIGTLTTKGCIGTIDHIKGDRKVHIQWDTSANNKTGAGTAFVQKATSGKVVCQITDKNMSNNNCQCSSSSAPGGPKKPPTGRNF